MSKLEVDVEWSVDVEEVSPGVVVSAHGELTVEYECDTQILDYGDSTAVLEEVSSRVVDVRITDYHIHGGMVMTAFLNSIKQAVANRDWTDEAQAGLARNEAQHEENKIAEFNDNK
jgi:hypothetical protein